MDMQRFDGAIAGIGTASGARLVVGMWPRSPHGSVTDVMIERSDGHRILLAPSQQRADMITTTDVFDEVRVAAVLRVRDGRTWMISTGDLALTFHVGRRPVVGWLLTAVPPRLARTRWWTTLLDPITRLTMDGVRTRRTTVGGSEWYSPLDLHRIRSVTGRLDGVELGDLRPVTPPVHFGSGPTPRVPSLVRLTRTIG